jgi:hypothetical protein
VLGHSLLGKHGEPPGVAEPVDVELLRAGGGERLRQRHDKRHCQHAEQGEQQHQ